MIKIDTAKASEQNVLSQIAKLEATITQRRQREAILGTDNGVGDYTVNFTTAMPDANYATCGSAVRGTTDNNLEVRFPLSGTYTTTAVRINTVFSTSAALDDAPRVTLIVLR